MKHLILPLICCHALMATAANVNVLQFNVGTIVVPTPPTEPLPDPPPPPSPAASQPNVLLALPEVGSYSLTVVSSNVIELFRCTQKDPPPAPYNSWDFIEADGTGSLPATSAFAVWTNGTPATVLSVAFKRRVLYGPATLGRYGQARDLRVGNQLYLTLAGGLSTNAVVVVSNVGSTIWSGYNYATTNSWTNVSPVLHVNQTGYLPGRPKYAYAGFYLGSGGELAAIPGSFQLLDSSNAVAFSGTPTLRPDVGYSYSPTPYQKVYELDFSAFDTPGQYRVFMPGLGCSYPFWIEDGVAAAYARTYALGVYHQRCGAAQDLPYTRHYHNACHTNLAYIPAAGSAMSNNVNAIIQGEGTLDYISDVYYPYVDMSRREISKGHHDAGDYSKYTSSVAKLIHFLTFAVDCLPGVRNLDNLGLPESGNGVPDLLDEAKWEADYLAKIQDTDGGFYWLAYPTNGQYQNTYPENPANDQLMMPKGTACTAAAVGALAEIASSPAFKAAYPAESAAYLTKALNGWTFLTNAFAAHGFDGAYQEMMFHGAIFGHTDEVFYAACSLYLATTNTYFSNYLRQVCPTPYSADNRRWGWWSCFEGYGFGFQQLAFAEAARKLPPGKLDAAYLDSVKAELRFAGTNNKTWSDHMAYGSSFSDENKGIRSGGWYFSSEWALDSAVAYALDGRAQDLDVVLKNLNYEMGANPVSVSYLTGTGYKRQRETVNLLGLFDDREWPPSGIPLGNIQAGYFDIYGTAPEMELLSYPADGAATAPYAYYDRWSDAFNTTTEWVVSQAARSLATVAYVAALQGQTNQVWNSQAGLIVLSTNKVLLGTNATCYLTNAAGIVATNALTLWEVEGETSTLGVVRTLMPTQAGYHRIEAEALLPDGRRLFGRTNFYASMSVTNNIENYQPSPNNNVVAWFKFDGTLTDTSGANSPLAMYGSAAYDPGSWSWTNRPAGQSVRLRGLGDYVAGVVPNSQLTSSDAISIEYMAYVQRYNNYGNGNATFANLNKNSSARLHSFWTTWESGPVVEGVNRWVTEDTYTNALTLNAWHHVKISITSTGYVFAVDGLVKTNKASSDLSNWGGSGNAQLQVGEWDGWLDELVIKKGY